MNLSEFQNKDVINLNDGKKIGNIIDYKISFFLYIKFLCGKILWKL